MNRNHSVSMNTHNSTTRKLVVTAIVASIYATLTLALPFMSYGPLQFRIAEILTLLPFIKKDYIWGLTLGCFLANVIGPYGLPDIVFGTIATFVSVYSVYLTGKYLKDKKYGIWIASLWPTIFNAIIIGTMLYFVLGQTVPAYVFMIEVGLGQFAVITILGVPVFKLLQGKIGNKLENLI